MKFTMTIEMGGEAFEDNPASELERILFRAVNRLSNPDLVSGGVPLMDVNGNTVGRMEVTGWES